MKRKPRNDRELMTAQIEDDFDWEAHEALLADCCQEDGEVGLSYFGDDELFVGAVR